MANESARAEKAARGEPNFPPTELVVVDVVSPRSREPFFYPLQRNLIPEYRSDTLRGRPTGLLNQIGGVLPGERLTVDFVNRTGRTEHRLDLPENRKLAEVVRNVAGSEPGGFQSFRNYGRVEETPFAEGDVLTWAYWLARLVDERKLRYVEGSAVLPPAVRIAALGADKIRTSDDMGLTPKPGRAIGTLAPAPAAE